MGALFSAIPFLIVPAALLAFSTVAHADVGAAAASAASSANPSWSTINSLIASGRVELLDLVAQGGLLSAARALLLNGWLCNGAGIVIGHSAGLLPLAVAMTMLGEFAFVTVAHPLLFMAYAGRGGGQAPQSWFRNQLILGRRTKRRMLRLSIVTATLGPAWGVLLARKERNLGCTPIWKGIAAWALVTGMLTATGYTRAVLSGLVVQGVLSAPARLATNIQWLVTFSLVRSALFDARYADRNQSKSTSSSGKLPDKGSH
jgi:hypothetical protein